MIFTNIQISFVQAAFDEFTLRKSDNINEVNTMNINTLNNQQYNKKVPEKIRNTPPGCNKMWMASLSRKA